MRNSRTKQHLSEHKNNQIINLMNLKLIESRNNLLSSCRQSFTKNGPGIINTPSTLANSKKYYSCELSKPTPNQHQRKFTGIQAPSPVELHTSATKILTLNQIKYKSHLVQAQARNQKEPKRSNSRKIFVSIAKSNKSTQKRSEHQIRQIDCKMLDRQPSSLRQKLKINIYKDIARNNNAK